MNKTLFSSGLKAFALIVMVSSVASAQSTKKMQGKAMQGKDQMMQKTAMSAKSQMSRAYLNNHNIPSSGVAMEGYCPIAYFAANKPIKGKPEFASTYEDITYHLVNADAKAAFDKNPAKYVPAYGGWCATGMAMGDKFPVDPKTFKIVDGKLHLFLKNKNVDALALWNKGAENEQAAAAAAHWAKVNN